jgi:hypothetical protein
MVTTKLYGRCGNQMFQIAATIGYACANQMDWVIPNTTINPAAFPTYFPDIRARFGKQVINDEERSEPFFVYKEPTHAFSPIPKKINIQLDGYFQSEKYFRLHRDEVVKAFNIPYLQREDGWCSVHVRRGDYVNLPEHHPLVSMEWYEHALRLMDVGRYMIFSDDIAWCKEHFTAERFPHMTFRFVEGGTEIQDLQRMSQCEHNIIANSSFSWWAAWLNPNLSKIVIAPAMWFGEKNAHLDTKDLLPSSWIKL